MSETTAIEWTDATWNPVRGCTRVSPGCGGPGKAGGCYAEIMAARFSKPGQWGHGFAEIVELPGGGIDHRWTGKVELVEDKLQVPLRWKEPRRIFVNSTSDLFHEKLPDEAIDRVFAVMALCPQHTFQILTKHPERLREYLSKPYPADNVVAWQARVCEQIDEMVPIRTDASRAAKDRVVAGPLPNVWLGTSCEDQATADARIPHLLNTPAAIRFLSCEPMLGPIDLAHIKEMIGAESFVIFDALDHPDTLNKGRCRQGIDWVICGGESGPGARPMHPDWARSLRDQCAAAGVPFFFKQWGEWLHETQLAVETVSYEQVQRGRIHQWPDETASIRVGKRAAGHLLDGRDWNQFPATSDNPHPPAMMLANHGA